MCWFYRWGIPSKGGNAQRRSHLQSAFGGSQVLNVLGWFLQPPFRRGVEGPRNSSFRGYRR